MNQPDVARKVVASTDSINDTTSGACLVDVARPCEIWELVRDAPPDAFESISTALPCHRCRWQLAQLVSQLARVRLGRHERRILLAAPVRDTQAVIIPPARPGRAADEAHRRAIRRLTALRLLESYTIETDIQCRDARRERPFVVFIKGEGRVWRQYKEEHRLRETKVYRRSVRLTPLGLAVVDCLRGPLQEARRIRWSRYRDRLLGLAARPPAALLTEFRHELDGLRYGHARVFALAQMLEGGTPEQRVRCKQTGAEAERHYELVTAVANAIDREERPAESAIDALRRASAALRQARQP